MITSTALQPTIKANGLAFDDIVRKAGLGAMPADARFCPDRYVGRIGDFGDQKDWNFIASSGQERDPALPAILLVMESPHKDEFSKKLWYTPWPANGPTGRQIRRHAHLLVPSDWVKDSAQLALLNAIPYQCSLGSTPSKYRDSVFRAAWAAGGAAFFQERLLQSYRPGDLVVNACTKGRSGRPLREDVESAIAEVLPGARRLRLAHPFSWMTAEKTTVSWAVPEPTPQRTPGPVLASRQDGEPR